MARPALLLAAALLLGARQPARVPNVWLVGDSTMAARPDTAPTLERGWGQMLAGYLDPAVRVHNHAANGRSTRSFLAQGRWAAVRDSLRAGDVVLVEFGHNDQKTADSARYTNPYTGFRRNLALMAAEARARGATPVLLTPIARRHFNAAGTLEDTHGAYTQAVRDVARELGAPLVDLQLLTEELIAPLGPERSKALFVWVAPGASPFYPEGRQDDTHLNAEGARQVARLAARALRAAGLPVGRYVTGAD